MTIHDEIKNALARLGYKDPVFQIKGDDPARYIVLLDDGYFGVWDSGRKTFVD